jgi:hypothetical protein
MEGNLRRKEKMTTNISPTTPAHGRKRRFYLKTGAVGALLLTLCLALPSSGDSGKQAKQDPVLALLQNIYWRAFYGEITLPTDQYGNATVGKLVFMALPNAPGDGTPASINITLKADELFFVPLWNILGNSYNDGTADPVFDVNIFRTLDIKLTLNGVTLIDSSNVMAHYSDFDFVPPIPYDFPPATAFIHLQGISELHDSLSSGQHVMHLDAKNTDTVDIFGLTFEYHNTWNITVNPKK